MYGDRAKLLFTDTDRLMYEIKTDDFYKDISPDLHDKFDTSNYPEDHQVFPLALTERSLECSRMRLEDN